MCIRDRVKDVCCLYRFTELWNFFEQPGYSGAILAIYDGATLFVRWFWIIFYFSSVSESVGIEGNEDTPVSYTHLDVYKRQVFN